MAPETIKPQPQTTCSKNLVKFGHVVPELCKQTHRRTDYRQRQSTKGFSSSSACAHTHTRTRSKRPFVRDYPGRSVPEETFTHLHPSWSSDILYRLPSFTTIHSILCVQLTCLTVLFDNLSPGPLWSSSWSWTLYFILHAFLHPVIIIFSVALVVNNNVHTCWGSWWQMTWVRWHRANQRCAGSQRRYSLSGSRSVCSDTSLSADLTHTAERQSPLAIYLMTVSYTHLTLPTTPYV